jgi:23S rRNA pseudouridine1911/1915/1917 synthase
MGGDGRGWARELNVRVKRQFLHAARLGFKHPATGEDMQFEEAFPDDLASVVAWAQPEATDIRNELS